MVDWCMYNCMEALRIAGILLQPIMPTKAAMLLDEMNVHPDRRALSWAERGADLEYGLSPDENAAKGKVNRWDTIFPPLATADYSDKELEALLPFVGDAGSTNRTSNMAAFLALEAKYGQDGVRQVLKRRKSKLEAHDAE